MYGVGDIFATFLAGGTKTLFCDSMGSCMFRPLSDDAFWEQSLDRDDPGIRELAGAGFEYRRVSLAPDESSVALALGADGLGWMELDADGRHRVFRIPRDVEVGGVAALEGARVIAGLSNGDVLLIDVDRGAIMRAVRTRKTEIGPITRLNNTRIAVASQGSFERPYQDWEILIVSLRDLSVLQRLTFNQSIASGYDISRATTTYIERLAASGDGRWLAAALANSQGTRPIVQLWDTTAVQDSMVLGSHALPIGRVEFDSDSNLLLVDSDWTAALWNLKDGHIVRQFRHGFSVDGETSPPLLMVRWFMRLAG